MIYESARTFRIWDYQVSHDRLLLRSPKSEDEASNHDIIFYGVEFLNIPTMLRGLEISATSRDEIRGIAGQSLLGSGATSIFRLTSAGEDYFVFATGFKVTKNTLDIFTTSLNSPAEERTRKVVGEVLAHS